MKKLIEKSFFLLFGLLITLRVHAQESSVALENGREGGGGCPLCQESYERGLMLAKVLQEIGLTEVQKKVPKIESLDSLYSIVRSRKVVPVRKLPGGRTMKSYPKEGVTEVVKKSYAKLSTHQRNKLELHEILVLMGIEIDGEYIWSNSLLEFFPDYDRLDSRAKAYSFSSTSCLIHLPLSSVDRNSYRRGYDIYRFLDASGSSLEGVCRYFNLGQVVASKKSFFDTSGYSIYTAVVEFYQVDKNGVIYNTLIAPFNPRVQEVVESIECTIR
jgi:hypothetical protein